MGDVHRRRVLVGMLSAGAVGMAGCTYFDSSTEPVPEISVQNHSNQTSSLSLTVWNRASEEVVVDDEFSLAADETRRYQQPFETAGDKALEITVDETNSRSFAWYTDAEQNDSGLSVLIQDNGDIQVSQTAA